MNISTWVLVILFFITSILMFAYGIG
jgi:preprotein translocase subunit SecG